MSSEILDALDHFCKIILRHGHSRMSILHVNHGVFLHVLISLRRNQRPPAGAANHFCHYSCLERLRYMLFINICLAVIILNRKQPSNEQIIEKCMFGLIVRRLRAWSSRSPLITANHYSSYRYDKNARRNRTVRTFSDRSFDSNSCVFGHNARCKHEPYSLSRQTKQPSLPRKRLFWLRSRWITFWRLCWLPRDIDPRNWQD